MFTSMDMDGSGDLSLTELLPVVFPRAKPVDLKEITAFVLDKFSRKLVKEEKKVLTAAQIDDMRSLFKVRRARARRVVVVALRARGHRAPHLGPRSVVRPGQ